MDDRRAERIAMVVEQIAARGISSQAILEAFESVPRHLFVPEDLRAVAHADRALRTAEGYSISQPYIAAIMLALSGLAEHGSARGKRLLDVGTGSGYAAALGVALGAEVWSLEYREDLAYQARARLMRLGYGAVCVRRADGHHGWPEAAPFDAIICSAACEAPPEDLVRQLAPEGRLVIPLGPASGQYLCVITKAAAGPETKCYEPVRFGPLAGVEG